ncbi:MAG: ATP-binding protein [Pseudobdellovibrionaceae bacterium]
MDTYVGNGVQFRHMIRRLAKLSKSHSFFLFGPRGTGKSTLLKSWKKGLSVLYIDLLQPEVEARYSLNPQYLLNDWQAEKSDWIVIDEIQKVPKLLDVVQMGIVNHKIKFALTGSSARKLKRGSANLLGGRAFDFHLHPFTSAELKEKFSLIDSLRWGSLPEIFELETQDKKRRLYSYVSTYLKEEVLIEQLVRKIEPFRKFLEVAAQMNGKILNYAKISRDAGIEEKNVSRYYQILDDTLVGFFLEPYENSVRKRQTQKAKFYFFDTGVTRALQNTLEIEVVPQTEAYGNLFEQFFILECIRMNDYLEKRFKFSYLKTKDNLEIDLIIERPGKSEILIEIKSKPKIAAEDASSLLKIKGAFKKPELLVVSNQTQGSVLEEVHCLHWKKALEKIFGSIE